MTQIYDCYDVANDLWRLMTWLMTWHTFGTVVNIGEYLFNMQTDNFNKQKQLLLQQLMVYTGFIL